MCGKTRHLNLDRRALNQGVGRFRSATYPPLPLAPLASGSAQRRPKRPGVKSLADRPEFNSLLRHRFLLCPAGSRSASQGLHGGDASLALMPRAGYVTSVYVTSV